MKTTDIESHKFFPSRIEGALGYYVTRLQFAREGDAEPNAVFYYRRGNPGEWDNRERVVTPEDFCEIARLPDELSEADKDVALAQAVEFAEYVERQAKGAMVDAARRFLSLPYSREIAARLSRRVEA